MVIFLFGLLISGKVAFAEAEGIELSHYTISDTGNLDATGSWVNSCYELFPNYIKGFQMFSGDYPSTSNVITTRPTSQTCGALTGNYTMERGFIDGTKQTPDGNYWVRIGTEGVEYSYTDWNSTWYYVKATRNNGIWSTMTQPMQSMVTDMLLNGKTPDESDDILFPLYLTANYNNLESYPFNYLNICYQISNTALAYNCRNIDISEKIGENKSETIVIADLKPASYYQLYSWLSYNPENTIDVLYDSLPVIVNFTSSGEPLGESPWYIKPVDPKSKYLECESLEISCHIRNAFTWAFYPDNAVFYKYQDLGDEILRRAPFGYAKLVYDKLKNLELNPNSSIVLGNVEAIDEMIFDPMRNGVEYILYFVFMVGLYFRFKDIEI